MNSETLCWSCAHATEGKASACPWAREFQPVPGWNAKKNLCDRRRYESYRVRKCPLYEPDKKPKKTRLEIEKEKAMREVQHLHGEERRIARLTAYKKHNICWRCGKNFLDGYRVCSACREKARKKEERS